MPPRLCERMSWMFYGSINFSGAQRRVCRPRHNNVINVFRSTRHLLLSFFRCRLNRMTLRGSQERAEHMGNLIAYRHRVSMCRFLHVVRFYRNVQSRILENVSSKNGTLVTYPDAFRKIFGCEKR